MVAYRPHFHRTPDKRLRLELSRTATGFNLSIYIRGVVGDNWQIANCGE
jgi:hypothetical protein